ncbi:MAG: hypothetical protein JXR97_01225 [Planctomycetes bacterium]|nr:hypothetical protein [Planctomycetota bacterium]
MTLNFALATVFNDSTLLTSVFFVTLALIMLVVLAFLYRLTLAIGRLDRRLEQLTRHLRDLNLYDMQPKEIEGVFGPETEMDSKYGTATDPLGYTPVNKSDPSS